MQLEDDDIREFTEAWQAEFGEALSPEAARHHASRLLELYTLLSEIGEVPRIGRRTNDLNPAPP